MNLTTLLLSLAFLPTALTPVNSTQFFIPPDTPSVIMFESDPTAETDSGNAQENASETEFILCSVNGQELQRLNAQTQNVPNSGKKRLVLDLTLPQGYFELRAAATGQTFGIVSLPPFCETETQDLQKLADPFFAIDGAMSWLVRQNDLDRQRDEMVQIARRSGIGMIRDRLSWNGCQTKPGTENIQLETPRHYDSCRKTAMRHGVLVLELCHDAPSWMEKTGTRYPKDLHAARDFWNVVTPAWNRTWGGMEVWNEPEISFGGELPADQYAAILKTLAYQHQNSPAEKQKLKETGLRTPLVGGVMATCHRKWLDTAHECGMLGLCDVFSFHTYAHAPAVEKIYSNFQAWLRDSGQPEKPMWLTECGRPWALGPGRPPQEQDLTSAIDIVMKGVEAKAFGIQRYFPFVFPYYEERENNFGMMSRDYTPLRSIAAYAQFVRVMAHREYLGDLPIPNGGWTHARVFSPSRSESSSLDDAKKKALTAVIYAPEPTARKLSLPCPILHAERVTGEQLPVDPQTNSLESPDGFVYVWIAETDARKFLNTQTNMNRLRAEKLGDPKAKTDMKAGISPLVLRYELDEEKILWNAAGYLFPTHCEEEVTLKFTVSNLSETSRTVPVSYRALCAGTTLRGPAELTVPANGTASFDLRVIPGTEYLKTLEFCPIEVTTEDRIVVKLRTTVTLDQLLSTAAETRRLELLEFSRWRHSSAPCCDKRKFAQTGDTWTLMAHFTEGDHWIYPHFTLPENVDLSQFDGVIVKARCWDHHQKTQVRFFAYQPNGAFFTSESIIPTDGEWHAVQIPFSNLTRCTAAGGEPAGDFDPKKVRDISFGANTKGDSIIVEIKDCFLYKK
ncbi:MAG: hypothetical protein E7029_07515 [Planctomycetaceae bacterium]|nr:hypothetical protein [Planctomycetaceae bacterium]